MAIPPNAGGAGGEELPPVETLYPPPETSKHNPQVVRSWIATWLLALLAAQIGASLLFVFVYVYVSWHTGGTGHLDTASPGGASEHTPPHEALKDQLDALKDILTVTFGPTVTLLGSVIGFFFGERVTRGSSDPSSSPTSRSTSPGFIYPASLRDCHLLRRGGAPWIGAGSVIHGGC